MTDPGFDRAMPEEYAAKLREAQASGSMVGERRLVTILFCDVRGSTAMAEALDPEDWAELMGQAFEHLIGPIYRYEGTVARLMGDSVLAFFGAPIAHEDDPERAVLAGLDILREVEGFSEQVRSERGLDFGVRVGINTGTVVVGPIGANLAMEYTAMGDAVNLAARLEGSAEPGTVLISHYTYRLVAPVFDVEALGGIEVKGKREPVEAFRVVGRKAEPGRRRGIEGLASPVVGRDAEFHKLRAVYEDFSHGRSAIVTLIGEAGLGKSRLIEELRIESEAQLEPGQLSPWAEVRGIPYESTAPYGLFLQQLRHTCGVVIDDSPEAIHEKLQIALAGAPAEARDKSIEAIELLLTFARQTGSEKQASSLGGERLKHQLFLAMESLWRGLVDSIGCTILVVDDLQWADQASVELLLHLFRLTDEMSILLLCAMRPDRQSPGWRVKTLAETDYPHRYTEIFLEPLSSQGGQDLIGKLLRMQAPPAALTEVILQKSEGNPFFIEELVRSLIEHGAVVQSESGEHWEVAKQVDTVPLPDTLHAILIARIDRLEKQVQRTLHLASVIGRSFYHRVLARVSQLEDELDRHLNTLQRVEIIRESARVPELEYIFRHELTRDAAYQSILRKRRREFHKRVAQAIEELFSEMREEFAPVLAHHFREAGEQERSRHYYTLAGDAAARLFANAEAVSHYSKAIKLAEQDAVSADQLMHLYLGRGRAFELDADYEQALANYEELEAIASERSDPAIELASLLARATLRVTINPAFDPAKGQALCDRALQLARELGDRHSEAKALWSLLLLHTYTEQWEQGVNFGQQALAIARDLDDREVLAYVLHDLSVVYPYVRGVEQSQNTLDEVNLLWKELGNTAMLADNYIRYMLVDLLKSDFENAHAHAAEAYDLSHSIDNLYGRAISRLGMANAYVEQGRLDAALPALKESKSLSEQAGNVWIEIGCNASLALAYGGMAATERGLEFGEIGRALAGEKFPPLLPLPLAVLTLLHLKSGEPDAAAASAAELEDFRDLRYRTSFPPPIYFRAAQAQGEIALAEGDYASAISVSEDFLADDFTRDFHGYAPCLQDLKARALLAQGDARSAKSALEGARRTAQSLGSRWILWEILAHLAEIEAHLGNQAEADGLHSQAREIVEFIAEHAGSEELSESFRNRPEVRSLLEA